MKNNTDKKFNALSLFSGIGGFEVGMQNLGFDFKKALEWDAKCCITLNRNFNHYGEIKPTDITKIEPAEFYSGPIDYIVGGPPCQSFSAAGRRAGGVNGINDTRGSLFWYYCKFVDYFKPKCFVFENVKGILSSKKGEDFEIICNSFRSIGYKLFWRVINAADFGAPQTRERLFLVGIRADLNIDFKFPQPTHGPDSNSLQPYVTAGAALADLEDPHEIIKPYGGKYGHLLSEIPEGENYRIFTEEMGHQKPLFAWRSKFSGFLQKLNKNDLAKTIVAYQGRYDGPFHWNNRKCTSNELKRLQGFPDSFILPESKSEFIKQIGNSVVPLVALNIGKAILNQIEGITFKKLLLIESNAPSSIHQLRMIKKTQSKRKKINKYSDIKQLDLLRENLHTETFQPYSNIYQIEGYSVKEDYSKGNLNVALQTLDFSDKKGKIYLTSFQLIFYGGVTDTIKAITINLRSNIKNINYIQVIWLIAHNSIKNLTSYESLQPLYGHFTEPYPKFSINFENNFSDKYSYFQQLALSSETGNIELPYESLSSQYGNFDLLLKEMRIYGFDVRTHHTNRTIKPGNFRICYPFILPMELSKYKLWTDQTSSKINDFNIQSLVNGE